MNNTDIGNRILGKKRCKKVVDINQEKEILTDPYAMFMYAIKSPLNRKKYEGRLAKFFNFIGMAGETLERRCAAFEEKSRADPKWAASMIIEFLQSLKQRVENKEISGATVRDYVKPIRLFCEMNEITVTWKKIMRGLPRSRNYANDRAPTIDEIKKITGYPDKTNQANRLSDGFIRN